MSALPSIVQTLLMQQMMGSGHSKTGELKTLRLGIYLISALLLSASLILITYGSYLAFANNFDLPIAFILTGVVAFLFALITLSTVYIGYKLSMAKFKKVKSDMIQTAQETLNVIGEELKDPIVENPKAAVLVATLAGYLLGERF